MILRQKRCFPRNKALERLAKRLHLKRLAVIQREIRHRPASVVSLALRLKALVKQRIEQKQRLFNVFGRHTHLPRLPQRLVEIAKEPVRKRTPCSCIKRCANLRRAQAIVHEPPERTFKVHLNSRSRKMSGTRHSNIIGTRKKNTPLTCGKLERDLRSAIKSGRFFAGSVCNSRRLFPRVARARNTRRNVSPGQKRRNPTRFRAILRHAFFA